MNTYTVLMDRDEDGWWIASVEGVSGCHTQGRSIAQALRRAREVLAACVDDHESARLVPRVELTADARRAIGRYKSARERLEADRTDTVRAAAGAVALLTETHGMSVRDAGELLGLSHQRVHQILKSTAGSV